MAAHQQQQSQQALGFEDYLPVMAERQAEEGLMEELAAWFRLLMDPASGLITFASLRRNAPLLGLGAMSDDDLRGMLAEGDMDGDGALTEMEFCVLMVRLSPDLMDEARRWLDNALTQTTTMAAQQQQQSQPQSQQQAVGFEDYLPVMAERLGEEGLMEELVAGFRLLMDPASGLITFASLRRNAPLLGLGGMSDDDLRGMLAEGDVDGDGALTEMEFCVLMIRLSPDLMDEPRRWLDDAVAQASQFLFAS